MNRFATIISLAIPLLAMQMRVAVAQNVQRNALELRRLEALIELAEVSRDCSRIESSLATLDEGKFDAARDKTLQHLNLQLNAAQKALSDLRFSGQRSSDETKKRIDFTESRVAVLLAKVRLAQTSLRGYFKQELADARADKNRLKAKIKEIQAELDLSPPLPEQPSTSAKLGNPLPEHGDATTTGRAYEKLPPDADAVLAVPKENLPKLGQPEVNSLPSAVSSVLGSRSPSLNAKDGLQYVWIPPGSFEMGCSKGDNECSPNEKPPHVERIASGFWLSRTEVTQAAYRQVTGGNPSHFKGDQLPVETVSWKDADGYCRAIGGRLPSESEWEYAARAGDTSARYGNLDAIAWYDGNSGGASHPVALKQPNAFGLFDMLGNVWEWVEDTYPGTVLKIERGGSWAYWRQGARASDRGATGVVGPGPGLDPTVGYQRVGFRCVGEFRLPEPEQVPAKFAPLVDRPVSEIPQLIGNATSRGYVDFTGPSIAARGISLIPGSGFAYNGSYGGSWYISGRGSGFAGVFSVPEEGPYDLVVTHLTSADASCPGKGYSPITIQLNSGTVVADYDPAANHGGIHGMVTDRWSIIAHAGQNRLRWRAGALCTNYWIRRIEIQ